MDIPEKKTIKLDRKTALAKAEHYCAYQERAQQEIRDKLYEWGLWLDDVEGIISELIETNFLNEERFTQAYVSGKFNIKHWGKVKIKQGLKLKKIPEKMIQRALNGIDGDKYLAVILDMAQKKAPLIKEKDPFKRNYKLISYLMGKGFEKDVIIDVLKTSDLA
uniref:regulatory protein RecX n=1 Tax=Pedobacter schmidteae TaxID=2201271 RepID=UPI000EB1873B|nr:regulatory protein RecX [Pedobacter schmidteae]